MDVTQKKKPDDESGHKECVSNVVLANSEHFNNIRLPVCGVKDEFWNAS